MSAALALEPPELPTATTDISMGTCVRIDPAGGWAKGSFTEEGVVIRVVRPGETVRSQRLFLSFTRNTLVSTATRYVVQCSEIQRVCMRRQIEVVAF